MPITSVEAARAWRAKNINVAAANANAKPAERDPTFNQARTAREVSEAELAALAVLEKRGVLVHRETVRAEFARRLTGLREAMLQMPARLQSVLAAETDEAKVHDLLQDEIHAVLAGLAGVTG